jgi:hypothetical protein
MTAGPDEMAAAGLAAQLREAGLTASASTRAAAALLGDGPAAPGWRGPLGLGPASPATVMLWAWVPARDDPQGAR